MLLPSSDEVIKSRRFGMPLTKMTRHQRVSFAAMIKIAYTELLNNPDQLIFEYDLNSFLELIGIDPKIRKRSHLFTKVFIDEEGWEQEDKEAYALEKTLKLLMGKSIGMRFKNAEGKAYKVKESVLISDFTLDRKKITFSFGNWVRDNILSVGNAYIMSMPIFAKLKGNYSVALFEQLEQRRDFKRWEINVNHFRLIMGVDEGKYKVMSDFKTNVINKSIDEINQKTNYTVSFDQKKEGKEIKKFIFTWFIKDQEDDVFEQWKKFMRDTFINIPLYRGKVGTDPNINLIQINKEGMLYNYYNSDYIYNNNDAKRIWKYMFENQELLLIRSDKEKSLSLAEKDYSDYIGRNYLFDSEMYENIIFITPIKNKLKVRFYSGDTILLTEDELNGGVMF